MNETDANFEYVTDEARFAELCSVWRDLPAIGLDTEFIRTRTFYSKVGLLQIGDGSGCYLVDPLTIKDWKPFRRLLKTTQVIIHASGEDLGLLYRLLGEVPRDLFDTQLAAAFLGVGFSLSYRDVVSKFCGAELPKSETRSNWLQRPLSPAQLEYAADDVRFLPALREILDARLRVGNAWEWFAEDCRRLLAGAESIENPESWKRSYKQINEFSSLSEPGLILLQQLCYWREQEIRVRDMPRNWIADEKDLLALAGHLAHCEDLNPTAIRAAPGVNRNFTKRYAARLAEYLNQSPGALALPDRGNAMPVLTRVQRERLKLCRKLVSAEAERIGLSPELLGKRKQLQQIVYSHASTGSILWPEEMRGWRQQILAPALAPLLEEAATNTPG